METLFPVSPTKSYRAYRHDVVRELQKNNEDSVHHPKDKIRQIENHIKGEGLNILELFAGRGNLTKVYDKYGTVEAYDKKYLKTGDSFIVFHKLIAEKKTYDVIDLDPYGFPNRFFPDIYLLIDNGYLFLTMPKPHVNIVNGITQTHLQSYFGAPVPHYSRIMDMIVNWGICHWRKVTPISSMDLKSIWRILLKVEKVKATEYTGVKNR